MKLTLQQLESHLWGTANILRGKAARQDGRNHTEVLFQRVEAAASKTSALEPEIFRAGFIAHDERPEKWDAEGPLEQVAS